MHKVNRMIENVNKMNTIKSTQLNGIRVKEFVIENPDILSQDSYCKNLFFVFLTVLIQSDNTPSEMQLLYLNRLVNGCKCENTVEDYFKRSLSLKDSEINDFFSIMKDNQLKYNFVLEGLILLGLESPKQTNITLFAEMLELLRIGKEDLKCLSLISKSILEQNGQYYETAKQIMTDNIRKMDVRSHLKPYYVGEIIYNTVNKLFTAPTQQLSNNILINDLSNINKVTYQNLVIDLSRSVNFKNCDTVVFQNCRIKSSDYANFQFSATQNVSFIECEINDFAKRIAEFKGCGTITMKKCLFRNCGLTGNSNSRGGMFSVSDGTFIFENNNVEQCYIKEPLLSSPADGVLLEVNTSTHCEIKNNRFYNCSASKFGQGRIVTGAVYCYLFHEEGNIIEQCGGCVMR